MLSTEPPGSRVIKLSAAHCRLGIGRVVTLFLTFTHDSSLVRAITGANACRNYFFKDEKLKHSLA
jgi:hypothetical protein